MTEIMILEHISDGKTLEEMPKKHWKLCHQDISQGIVVERTSNNKARQQQICHLTEDKEVFSLICFEKKPDTEDKIDDPGKEIGNETKTIEGKIDGIGKEIYWETKTTEIERDLIKQNLIMALGILVLLNKDHDTIFKAIEAGRTEDQIRYV